MNTNFRLGQKVVEIDPSGKACGTFVVSKLEKTKIIAIGGKATREYNLLGYRDSNEGKSRSTRRLVPE